MVRPFNAASFVKICIQCVHIIVHAMTLFKDNRKKLEDWNCKHSVLDILLHEFRIFGYYMNVLQGLNSFNFRTLTVGTFLIFLRFLYNLYHRYEQKAQFCRCIYFIMQASKKSLSCAQKSFFKNTNSRYDNTLYTIFNPNELCNGFIH